MLLLTHTHTHTRLAFQQCLLGGTLHANNRTAQETASDRSHARRSHVMEIVPSSVQLKHPPVIPQRLTLGLPLNSSHFHKMCRLTHAPYDTMFSRQKHETQFVILLTPPPPPSQVVGDGITMFFKQIINSPFTVPAQSNRRVLILWQFC